MAYIALYRKYRPQTFTDVVGQHQVSDTLMRAIREDKVAHAYLFAGPRGTGKTSMAKIFARAINCEHGPTDHPCNECSACKSILSGQSMDVLEIDAASNRGIDEVRALRGAYCSGSLFGKHKLFPRISPAKSWEGSIGHLFPSLTNSLASHALLVKIHRFLFYLHLRH